MQKVQRSTGRSSERKLREIVQLAHGPGRLSPRAY